MEIATIPTKDLRHTRMAQEWIEEGRQEGRKEGEATATLRLLNRRCGSLSDATTARIQALLDFRGPADLAAWLAGLQFVEGSSAPTADGFSGSNEPGSCERSANDRCHS